MLVATTLTLRWTLAGFAEWSCLRGSLSRTTSGSCP